MSVFEDIHRGAVVGSLAMFDRLIFRGHLQRLFFGDGVRVFLWEQNVPLTNFGSWAEHATETVCQHAQRIAADAVRIPLIPYTESGVFVRGGRRRRSGRRSGRSIP